MPMSLVGTMRADCASQHRPMKPRATAAVAAAASLVDRRGQLVLRFTLLLACVSQHMNIYTVQLGCLRAHLQYAAEKVSWPLRRLFSCC